MSPILRGVLCSLQLVIVVFALFWAHEQWTVLLTNVITPMALLAELLLTLCSLRLLYAARSFLKLVPRLETADDLGSYRTFVRRQMYWTLAWGEALLLTFVIVSVAVAWECLHPVWALAMLVALSVRAFSILSLEDKIQRLPAADEHLEAERARIVSIWVDRMLPPRELSAESEPHGIMASTR